MSAARARAALLAVALGAPALATAHGGVKLEIERRDGAVAVRARHHGARPLAGATYVVMSPAGNGRVHDAGRTDEHGWMAFVPDVPGRWTVRIVDEGGHGKLAEIDVSAEFIPEPASSEVAAAPHAAPLAPTAAAPSAEPVVRPGPPPAPLAPYEAVERASSIYRVVAGLAVIGLVFFVAFAVAVRRRGAGR